VLPGYSQLICSSGILYEAITFSSFRDEGGLRPEVMGLLKYSSKDDPSQGRPVEVVRMNGRGWGRADDVIDSGAACAGRCSASPRRESVTERIGQDAGHLLQARRGAAAPKPAPDRPARVGTGGTRLGPAHVK
jgi:hypothetical protein